VPTFIVYQTLNLSPFTKVEGLFLCNKLSKIQFPYTNPITLNPIAAESFCCGPGLPNGAKLAADSGAKVPMNYGPFVYWNYLYLNFMIISQRKALLMLCANALLLVIGILRFTYYKEWSLASITPERVMQWQFTLLNMIQGMLIIIVYAGLFWVIKAFGEAKWLRSGLIVFIANKIFAILSPMVLVFIPIVQDHLQQTFQITHVLLNCSMLYVFFVLTNVKAANIRNYYRFFGLSCIMLTIINFVAPMIYNRYSFSWLLIDIDPLYQVPFLSSLLIFLYVYKLSKTATFAKNELTLKEE